MAQLKILKPDTEAGKVTRTATDTIEVTPTLVEQWLDPPFQRPLKVNARVLDLATEIRKDGGVIPGTIILGVLNKQIYLVDGQHRRKAFLLSGCEFGYVDVKYKYFTSMADMGEEFVALNSRLVSLKPDDIMRGLEGSMSVLARIRKKCPFVGYDSIRRNEKSPVLSMSATLRCWAASAQEVPALSGTAVEVAKRLGDDPGDPLNVDSLITFLDLAWRAWGSDQAYHRLWTNLNVSLCMWIYQTTVVSQFSTKSVRLTRELFTQCLMSLSADPAYISWIHGRHMNERDRSPAYKRIKDIFTRRIQEETGKKPFFPSPSWVK